jgi:hypothetical protein
VTGARAVPFRSALPYLAPLVLIALEWGFLSPTPALGDHFQFWAAGRIVVDGRSPYDPTAWAAAIAPYGSSPEGVAANTITPDILGPAFWLYPPQTAFIFAPFAALPLSIGIPLLHLALLGACMAGAILTARAVGLQGIGLALGLSAAVVSLPFAIGVRDGHLDGIALTGMALSYAGLRGGRARTFASGTLLASLKPHVTAVFVVVALAYAAARDRRALFGAGALVALVAAAAEIRTPFPFAVVPTAVVDRSVGDSTSTTALARDLGGGAPLAALLVVLAIAAAAIALRWARPERRPAVAFGALSALSLVPITYLHEYDDLLTLPAILASLALATAGRPRVLVAAAAIALLAIVPWVLFFWWSLAGDERPWRTGLLGALPILALLLLAAAARE